jgi:hypothetical protein
MPMSVCSSRRIIYVHLRSGRRDPITSITRVDNDLEYRLHGKGNSVTVPIDLRGYVPGPVRVILHATTRQHHPITYNRLFHPCGGATS